MDKWKREKELVGVIDNEMAHLSTVFSTFTRLYRSDTDVRNLLADSDLAFFSDLYIIYLHYISVSVSRLLDPAKTGKKANLTIASLIEGLRAAKHPRSADFADRLKGIREQAYNFVDPRNQLVAHLDLSVNNIAPGRRPIPSFTKSEFDSFYKETGTLMNEIREEIGLPPNMYDWGVFGHTCGRKLLRRLEISRESIQEKTARPLRQDTD